MGSTASSAASVVASGVSAQRLELLLEVLAVLAQILLGLVDARRLVLQRAQHRQLGIAAHRVMHHVGLLAVLQRLAGADHVADRAADRAAQVAA